MVEFSSSTTRLNLVTISSQPRKRLAMLLLPLRPKKKHDKDNATLSLVALEIVNESCKYS